MPLNIKDVASKSIQKLSNLGRGDSATSASGKTKSIRPAFERPSDMPTGRVSTAAAAPRPRSDALKPGKERAYRAPLVKTGSAAGQMRTLENFNERIPLPASSEGRDVAVCKDILAAWFDEPKFIDNVVNAGMDAMKEHFAQPGAVKGDALVKHLEEQPPATRALVTNQGFGAYLGAAARALSRSGQEEAKVALATPDHVVGLKLRRKDDSSDRLVISCYDPNATGVQVKVQTRDVSAADLERLDLATMFPKLAGRGSPNRLCVKAMSVEGLELEGALGNAYAKDAAALQGGAAVELALMDKYPRRLDAIVDEMKAQGLTGERAAAALHGTREGRFPSALAMAAIKGSGVAPQTLIHMAKSLEIPGALILQALEEGSPAFPETPLMYAAAKGNGDFVEGFARGVLNMLKPPPQLAQRLLAGGAGDTANTAMGRAFKEGNGEEFVQGLSRGLAAANFPPRLAAPLFVGSHKGVSVARQAAMEDNHEFLGHYVESLELAGVKGEHATRLFENVAKAAVENGAHAVAQALPGMLTRLEIPQSDRTRLLFPVQGA